ncbi:MULTISPECIES: hypothetical protein [Hyphobacterium]|uniref:DUF4747 domain-containing protein n=1 Tax=Hyphobacterium vulgare TaxID=1736751 RepID=A0ABV6ZZP5_9PROT
MKRDTIQFANFICKFGDKPLVSFLEEIVLPAFTDDTLVREISDSTNFHLYDVKLDRLEDGLHVIYGRFIKNTTLSREQLFDRRGGIVHDYAELETSPSSFFILIVDNHRLIYQPETVAAPSIDTFRATIAKFIKLKYEVFFEKTYRLSKEYDRSVTRKILAEKIAKPRINIIPLSDPSGLEAFLRRYSKLKHLSFKIIETNDDDDASQIFEDMRAAGMRLESQNTEFSHRSRDGLNVDEAIDLATEATAHGYQHLKTNGLDNDGNNLSGDNENFALKQHVPDPPNDLAERTRLFVAYFVNLVKDKIIKTGESDNNSEHSYSKLFQDEDRK